ncbi:MAG TPA: regulatory signaling modulator protein AmpE [Usitatibacter sp.]|nr:regulatory signaling modulator protein AmpE [Usitatibacter sp.]
MSLLALLVSLLAQHAWPPQPRQPLLAFYGRMCLSAAKRLDAGDRNSGIAAWLLVMAAVLVPASLVTWAAAAIHPFVLWILDIVVLYATLRFLHAVGELGAIEKRLREGDTAGAASRLAQWQGRAIDADDAGTVARLAAEQAIREAHQGALAPLFWYLALPGPIGLVLYPLALRAAQGWSHRVDAEAGDFGWFAARAFHVIDWIPQRLTAFAFAVVGDFEAALYCWRSQASSWRRAEEAIVLASGAGALGVRLGDPIHVAGGVVARPTLGVGEGAREDALASLEGLLWRALALWLVVFLLAAALNLR